MPGGQRLRVQDIDAAAEALEQPGALTTPSTIAPGQSRADADFSPTSSGNSTGSRGDASGADGGADGGLRSNCSSDHSVMPVRAPDVDVIKARGQLHNILSDEEHPVVVFTRPSCALAWVVESALHRSKVPVRTVVLQDTPNAMVELQRALYAKYPSVGLPQIHVAGTLLGSFSDVCTAYASGELQQVDCKN